MIPELINSFLRRDEADRLRDAHVKRVARKLAEQKKRLAAQPETRPDWVGLRRDEAKGDRNKAR